MPFDALSVPDNFRVQGSLTVINDPNGNSGNVNVAGSVTASGAVTMASGLTVSGAANLAGGASVTSGLSYDTFIGGPPTTSTITQQLGGTTSTVTMTGSGRVIFLNPTATMSTAILTPTGSTSATSVSYTNGMEVVLVNTNPASASTITIPSASWGALGGAAITISGGQAARLQYCTALASWIHLA